MRLRLFLPLVLATPLLAQDGGQLYTLYCSACHGTDGKGATGGTFPPLSESPWVAGDADRAVKIVLKGIHGPVDVLGKTYNLEMPPQGAVLPDDQVASIMTFVRTSWGNQASPVTTDFVKGVRAAIADRQTPWTSGEILKLHPLPLEKTALTNLISQAYSGKWDKLPDFSTLKAENIEEEHDGIISLKDSPFEDNFALVWEAKFEAPADGEYEFMLDADDAAKVMIRGKNIVEVKGIGPMNGSRTQKGKVTLTKGNQPFRVEFLELTDQQGIALGWKGPGDKKWKWLSERALNNPHTREPIRIEPSNARPVIYRNFIAGTTPRAIGVGFTGGFNLAYSADDLAPELIWTGDFIDGAPKWIDRGTDNSPPAGENVFQLSKQRAFPAEAKFRGYKLDPAGNPTFSVQIGTQFLLDSWRAESAGLVRKVTINGNGAPIDFLVADHAVDDAITITSEGASLETHDGKTSLKLVPGKPVTLTYRWK